MPPSRPTTIARGGKALYGAPLGILLGDIAVNDMANTVWVTDGLILGEYVPPGAAVRSFGLPPGTIIPGALTGLGYGAGQLWITDGAFIAGIAPPPPPGCPGAAAIITPPWPVPAGFGFVTDVDFDPSTGTLWACTAAGLVGNLGIGGGLIAAFAPAACALAAPLTGLACDHATPTFAGAPLCLYISNGAIVSYITPPGGPGPAKFYVTGPCFPDLAAPSTGLSSSLHGITYGAGFDPMGPPFPTFASVGQSTTPSAGFGLVLASASPAPGTVAALFVDLKALCPAIPFKGNPLYCLPTLLVGPLPVVGGGLFLPAALPPALPVGASVYAQWVIKKGGGGFQVSNGLEFTFGLP